MLVQTGLKTHIQEAQEEVLKAENRNNETLLNQEERFDLKTYGVRYFKRRVWIPKISNLRELISDEPAG